MQDSNLHLPKLIEAFTWALFIHAYANRVIKKYWLLLEPFPIDKLISGKKRQHPKGNIEPFPLIS